MDRSVNAKAVAWRAFVAIADHWHLNDPERGRWLGLDSLETVSSRSLLLNAEVLDDRVIARISLTLGIYAALHALFDERFADLWIARPNARFGGKSAKDVVLENPERLSEIRAYVDSELNL